jgi:hypothetical protein
MRSDLWSGGAIPLIDNAAIRAGMTTMLTMPCGNAGGNDCGPEVLRVTSALTDVHADLDNGVAEGQMKLHW